MTEYAFEVVVEGIDVEDDEMMDRLDEIEGVVLLSEVNGIVGIHLAIDASTPGDAAQTGIHLVESAIEGCRVRRIDLDLVAAAEVADRVGVSRQAVNQWASGRRSGDPFPESLGVVARGSRVWAWSSLMPWLAAHGHAPADEVATLPFDVLTALNGVLAGNSQAGAGKAEPGVVSPPKPSARKPSAKKSKDALTSSGRS